MAREADTKAQLARDVSAASAVFSSCPHRRRSPRKPPFIDWYLILSINEEASEDAIRRQYRQLALQLHPDKNRHPKAEVAFKLVSEAYACLTDGARRRAFDAERKASFCNPCHARSIPSNHRNSIEKRNAYSSVPKGRPRRASQALREVQNRMQDECRVIESCLRANDSRRRQSFPLFDPSERMQYPDYPHRRTQVFENNQREFWHFQHQGGGAQNQKCRRRGTSCESPVYQIRTESTARAKCSW